ncbi:stage III sporulation protein SpoIIIAB [Ammoniphilus sp. CFH 90114]|uniref:stage III sporulation protein SpoIIIAB n=1 Tax=Ammoniphilus sp. CFH 90114 TaxID=2493665 RepID=UPI00100DAB06|nr:stage III sporulation protein SpoIIIAB [Ammoniphilus sp. CFH 90114]RXT13776.1 stage III sporulation protein AB [Ammoniphilus sp. CFH 90114]
MLKLLGASIILFSATMIGFQVAKMYSRRPKEIRRLSVALQLLETEICYGSTTLPLALEHVGKRVQGEIGSIFRQSADYLLKYDGLSTMDCWEMGVEKTWPKTTMRQAEKEILLHLGKVLGKSDRQDQQKHIRLAVMNLKKEEEEARMDQQKYEKMCKSLGVLSGILAVILMY